MAVAPGPSTKRKVLGLWGMPTLLGVLLVTPACHVGAKDPEAVVEQFIAVANTGQNREVFKMLGPRSQERLAQLRQSAKRVSGRLALEPEDFLAVGRAPAAWEAAGVRLLRRSDNEASVQVYSTAGDRHTVTLVKSAGQWKVELPDS